MSASISFDASIPLPDLNSAVYISVPFSFSYPSARSSSVSASSGRSFSDTGLDSVGVQSPRSALYSGLESSVAHLTGADGHACLLRAMCEASSTPLHDEGLIGDAITFLLTANYVTDEPDNKFKKYFAAQAKGQVMKIGKSLLKLGRILNDLVQVQNHDILYYTFQLTGDCSEWHSGCPISLFKLIDNNII